MFDPDGNLDLDKLRARLAKMTDFELKCFGQAAAYMTSREANRGAEPRPIFVLQLKEAQTEWRRRHPKRIQPFPSNPSFT